MSDFDTVLHPDHVGAYYASAPGTLGPQRCAKRGSNRRDSAPVRGATHRC